MNDINSYWQDILQSFEEIDYLKFLLNLVVTAILATGLHLFYVHLGNAVTNRRRFARNFLPLAMTTMLIIFIVKSSVALSLGLVGALSIVRFRSAIKEPEELTYLFLTIGIGLSCGADEPMIAVISVVLICSILFIQSITSGKGIFKSSNQMHLNISTKSDDLSGITAMLSKNFSFVELKRMDKTDDMNAYSFIVAASSVDQLETTRNEITSLDGEAVISFIEQRNIAS